MSSIASTSSSFTAFMAFQNSDSQKKCWQMAEATPMLTNIRLLIVLNFYYLLCNEIQENID